VNSRLQFNDLTRSCYYLVSATTAKAKMITKINGIEYKGSNTNHQLHVITAANLSPMNRTPSNVNNLDIVSPFCTAL